jgi:hypothetical protein
MVLALLPVGPAQKQLTEIERKRKLGRPKDNNKTILRVIIFIPLTGAALLTLGRSNCGFLVDTLLSMSDSEI